MIERISSVDEFDAKSAIVEQGLEFCEREAIMKD